MKPTILVAVSLAVCPPALAQSRNEAVCASPLALLPVMGQACTVATGRTPPIVEEFNRTLAGETERLLEDENTAAFVGALLPLLGVRNSNLRNAGSVPGQMAPPSPLLDLRTFPQTPKVNERRPNAAVNPCLVTPESFECEYQRVIDDLNRELGTDMGNSYER